MDEPIVDSLLNEWRQKRWRKNKMENPTGCDRSVLIAFISDEKMRPRKDHSWLVDILLPNGDRSVSCQKSLADAYNLAADYLEGRKN